VDDPAQQAVQPEGAYAPLGDRLRQRRRDLKLTLQEVADRAGLSVGFISQIERGITTPSMSAISSRSPR
jgi:predicted transcriptional regulator